MRVGNTWKNKQGETMQVVASITKELLKDEGVEILTEVLVLNLTTQEKRWVNLRKKITNRKVST